ncbi:MAG: hypothetical protein PHI12_06135 [Dehalococcoidales bacterium]|nr:hypothetical protein [Dehalococcoidales bacterium]
MVTQCLVRGSQEGKQNRVFSFTSRESPEFTSDLDWDNIQNILVLRHESNEDSARRWKDKIGLLWLNTPGDYKDLKRILRCWESHLSHDARVVMSNYNKPGTNRVIKEYLSDQGNFTYDQTIDNTIVFTIDQCVHYWIINSDCQGICKYCGRKRNFKRLINEAKGAETGRVKRHIRKAKEDKHADTSLKTRRGKKR